MFEADALCNRIAVIARGRIVGEGTPRELKAAVTSGTVVEVETYGVADDAVARIRAIDGVASVAVEEHDGRQVLRVQSPAGLELTQAILGCLDGAAVGRVVTREPTLEDAYVALVEDEAAPA